MADDFSEIMQLAKDLGEAAGDLSPLVRSSLQHTAFDVKKEAQESVRQRNGFGHAANAISYETKESASGASAEIGYDKGKKAGELGNLIEFGAPNAKKHILVNGHNVPVPGGVPRPLAPSHDLGNALLNNEEDFVRGLEKAADEALKRGGL